MILFGLFGEHPWLTATLGLTVILSVIYMLRWMQKMYFEVPSPFQTAWVDIKGREKAIAFPLIVLVLWVGLYPAPILTQVKQAAFTISSGIDRLQSVSVKEAAFMEKLR
jgi:NADH-quinone oxidoreductase subunit M